MYIHLYAFITFTKKLNSVCSRQNLCWNIQSHRFVLVLNQWAGFRLTPTKPRAHNPATWFVYKHTPHALISRFLSQCWRHRSLSVVGGRQAGIAYILLNPSFFYQVLMVNTSVIYKIFPNFLFLTKTRGFSL